MGTQGTGRKRSTKKERSTAEDDALNLIAREAEARLAAKRAARAEAREIRMRELERQQKEIFQVQKKYYGLDTRLDDRGDSKWGDIEQWMEDSERYSRSSRTQTDSVCRSLTQRSDDDERMSVGSRGSVRSDLEAVGAYSGGGSVSHKKSKKKKKHKHKDRDRNGYEDDYSVISSRQSSRLSDESRVSRSSRLDLTSSRLSDDSRASRSSRLELQPASYASSDLYSLNGLSTSRNTSSAFNGYQNSLYEDSLCSRSRRASASHPVEYSSYRGSRTSSRASSARTSPVDNCGSVASFLRSAASSLPRDLDDVTIPDFSDVEESDYLEKGSRAASALTAGTLTSLGGTSSRRGSGETALTVDAETSLREIKEIHELKDQIQDVEIKYTQNLKEVKYTLTEVEEKYRKAMVSNAQLDNEKNNLMYQVDTLKDSLMELEELLSESQRGYEDKVKELEREKHAHSVLQFQFSEIKETLKQSEELLNEIRQLNMKQEGFVREISDLQETVEWKDKKIGALERQKEYTDAIRIERDDLREEVVKLKDILKKHGVVLGSDLNVNGDVGEAGVDGAPSTEPVSSAEPQASPPEGNSMLGNPEETLEEELQPKQHREMFEEAKENQLGSENVGVPMLEAPTDELPAREPESPTEDVEEVVHEHLITKDKDIFLSDDSPNLQAVTSSSERNPSPTLEEGVSLETDSVVEMESKGMLCSDYPKESCNISEHQEPQLDASSSALQKDPQSKEEADKDEEADKETSTRSQGAAAAGKKKKKKKRAKKKGGVHEDEKRHANKETCSEEKATESTAELAIDGSITKVADKAEDGQDRQETGEGELTKPTESFIPNEAIGETVVNDDEKQGSEVDNIVVEASTAPESVARVPAHALEKEKDELNLESETGEAAEAVEIFEPPRESRTDAKNDEQDDEQGLETETVETVEAVKPDEPSDIKPSSESRADGREDEETPKTEERSERCCVPEERCSSSEHVHDSKSGFNADGVDKVGRTAVAESLREHDTSAGSIQTESGSVGGAGEDGHVDEIKLDSMNREPENSDSEPSVLRDDHISTVQSDSEDTSLPPGDGFESLSGSGPASVGADGPDKVVDEVSEEEDERMNDEEDRGENSNLIIEPELKPEEELKVDLREAGVPSESNCSSCEEKTDGLAAEVAAVLESEKSLEAPEPAEGLGDAEDQGFQGKDQAPEVFPDTTNMLNSPEPPQAEALHRCPEDDHVHSTESAILEVAEHKMSPNNRLHETPLNSVRGTLEEPIKDDWDDESAQPNLHESDEDEEEGQSFDFDDIDVETPVRADLRSPKMEAFEEGVEVLSDECDPGRSGPCQNPSRDPAGEEKCTVDAGQRSDTPETVASENMREEQKNPAEEEACVEEGPGPVVGQAVSSPVEEGLDALQQLHGGDLLLEKGPELVAGNPEPPQAPKEAKKNGKKAKAKGKEDCKMS
ncbi:leucine-rich repeat flightless-interacting protein 1 isoform X3 [Takifugu flavidus]|uniref:leucine-rich repeat flightless-interacting protein 1 isoform X3 n=1 Tax=Takifugu flavidus TaxID=433684 RepID=UPI002544A44A|nr:leucine-rich repeat flightless-interacting protein 1 isoform X3 [Takifugu flavidus]